MVNIACPKCGFEEPENATECARCGIIFGKWREDAPPPQVPKLDETDDVANGRVGPQELRILGLGLGAAILAYWFPLTRFVLSALVTLFHESGHAVAGWLFGYPAIPSFDFTYGGGITHYGTFHLPIALAVAAGFGYLGWLFRENRRSLTLIAIAFGVWLIMVISEWRREFVMAGAGHAFEFILAGILFYQALAGVGWHNPELERPFGAFAAFFVQIHSMMFAWRLTRDEDFLEWYKQGKGGMLMNDLESIALDLHIHTPFNPGIIGTARLLLLFSFLPITIALIWYFQRARWHRVLRALRTVDA
jgi:hypothetical protein